MTEPIILYGAGAAGRYALAHLRSQGIKPMCFTDSDAAKWGNVVDGLNVASPEELLRCAKQATWVACSIRIPDAREIRREIARLGVKSTPLWRCLPVCHGLPPLGARHVIESILGDLASSTELGNQLEFRERPDYDRQHPPSDIHDLYFPDFIKRLPDEHFVDCGAADGDTIYSFLSRWISYAHITAFEPDTKNFHKLRVFTGIGSILSLPYALSDHEHVATFAHNGDHSSHLTDGTGSAVQCVTLDHTHLSLPPTYIKIDIEGAELEALWGAREMLKHYMPVLAVCAYHKSDHLWQIPLLIHAIQPDYRLFLRRYAEGAFELVWYVVPPERVNR